MGAAGGPAAPSIRSGSFSPPTVTEPPPLAGIGGLLEACDREVDPGCPSRDGRFAFGVPGASRSGERELACNRSDDESLRLHGNCTSGAWGNVASPTFPSARLAGAALDCVARVWPGRVSAELLVVGVVVEGLVSDGLAGSLEGTVDGGDQPVAIAATVVNLSLIHI